MWNYNDLNEFSKICRGWRVVDANGRIILAYGRGTAERGPEKVERGRRWSAGKRSAVLNFYPYRTRIGSHI